MKYVSTRATSPAVSLSDAIAAGLAPDGGLYVPQHVPRVEADQLARCSGAIDTAAELLRPYFSGDALERELPAICAEAFDLPLPVKALSTPEDYVIELFHGPTAAFKDFGARFLAAALARVRAQTNELLTVLVATSGDTGAAVAAAFHRRRGFRVVVLFPEGKVSPRQAHQLGCFGDNVTALRVRGTFDDCQALVKRALADRALQERASLTSANSISLGRFLPQVAYYAIAVMRFQKLSTPPLNLVIPTGNLGNALAAVYAREMGMPIGRIVLASNANDVLPRYFEGADYEPRPSVATIANAMDVGAPSNFERLRHLLGDDEVVRQALAAASVTDDDIRETIRSRFARSGEVFDPHTATAVAVLQRLRNAGAGGSWAIVATAHPAKFENIVEPIVGEVRVPPALAELLARRSESTVIENDYAVLRDILTESAE